MAGFTLNCRQTSLLADIVSACWMSSEDAVPWPVLSQVQALLRADLIIFTGFDTLLPQVWLDQRIKPAGEMVYLSETAAEARANPFWINYWRGPCSYPDRTGDLDSVTTLSDFLPIADVRAGAAGPGLDCEREIIACLPGYSAGSHLRLLCARQRGRDFTDLDRFFLVLLRPHLERAFWTGTKVRAAPPRLSRRQLEILRMVQAGLTNQQIARRVKLAEGTVRTHLNRIYARLGVTSRTAAVDKVFAFRESWPTSGPEPGSTGRSG